MSLHLYRAIRLMLTEVRKGVRIGRSKYEESSRCVGLAGVVLVYLKREENWIDVRAISGSSVAIPAYALTEMDVRLWQF